MTQVERHAPHGKPPAMATDGKRGLSRSDAADLGTSARLQWARQTGYRAQAGQRLAVPASSQTPTREPTGTCPDPGRLWGSRRGESDLGNAHGLCRTDPSDLKTDE